MASFLQPGMLAGEARGLGEYVADNVPDCAEYWPTGMGPIDATENPDGSIAVKVTINGVWRWLTMTVTVKDGVVSGG